MRSLRTIRTAAAALLLASPMVSAQTPSPSPKPRPTPSTAESEWAVAVAHEAVQEAAKVAQEVARASAQVAKEVAQEVAKEIEKQKRGTGEPRGELLGDRLAKVVKAPEGATVVASNFSGNITVSAGAPGEVRVVATRRTRDKAEGSGTADDGTRVSIEERAGRVEVKTWGPWKRHQRATVDFDLVVPASATVEAKSLSGDIAVSGVKGSVTAETVSGSVTATALATVSSLKTVSGNVTLTSSTVAGDVTAASVSGDVTAKGVKARTVKAGTVSGNVAVLNTSCERAVVGSVSGNVEIGGPLQKSARYELKSHSGDVRVVIDGKTGFELDATTWSGSISNDFGIKGPVAEASGYGPRQKSIQGVFGDGSAQIQVTSFSGSVAVVKVK
jgi:hypothetical protein